MLKRILLGTLFVGLIGLLVAGAVIRTSDRTGRVAEASGRGSAERGAAEHEVGASRQGRGYRGGQGEGAGREYAYALVAPDGWTTYEGTVVEAPADGVDLTLDTGNAEIVVGTGPGYLEEQGLSLQQGELVRVLGYWEGQEFKAAEITRLSDDATVTLRDQSGRPAWSGAGRYGRRSSEETAWAENPVGQAQVHNWSQLEGTVVNVDSDELAVELADGEEVVITGRAWWFAQEEGFSAETGDEVTLIGFQEGDEFEAGQIQNHTTGQSVSIRDLSGRPLWAGGWR